ncbi:MAG TPA: hypothetical protein VGL57_07550 [Solirubrobacteraceae bacterium]
MSTWAWVLILGFGLIKLPIALLMLWAPFRNDAAVASLGAPGEDASSGEDDGGSKTLPDSPRRPGPHRPRPRTPFGGSRGPRRGPHGTPAPAAPARSRHRLVRRRRPTRIGV